MAIGIVGRKCGMTRVFNDDGASVPVTVIEVEPNRITQIKTDEADGYTAVQVTVGARRASRVNKSQAGHFAKAGVEAGRSSWELRVAGNQEGLEVGGSVTVDQFEVGQKIDVTGTSKGKGYAGVIKRWNFQMQDALTATLFLTVRPVLLVNAKLPVVFLKVRKWRAIWVMSVLRLKILKLYVLTLSAICSLLKVQYQVLLAVM